jgi:hypothetical protein
MSIDVKCKRRIVPELVAPTWLLRGSREAEVMPLALYQRQDSRACGASLVAAKTERSIIHTTTITRKAIDSAKNKIFRHRESNPGLAGAW